MANHSKTYGICENKCREEVYKKSDVDSNFATKANLNSYAQKNHATDKTTYGIGTRFSYGHLKVRGLNDFNDSTSGTALSIEGGTDLAERIREISPKVEIPVHGIGIFYDSDSPEYYASRVGYGTWKYMGLVKGQIYDEEREDYVNVIIGYAFRRES